MVYIDTTFSDGSQKKWTVATVNWKSYEYYFWQFKMLFDYNDPSEFELIIFDGMFPRNDKFNLEQLCKPYKKHGNIKIMYWSNRHEKGQIHGSELTEILKISKSKYFLSNDPDYFWLVKGHLKYLEKFFDVGIRSIGPHHELINGPCIWGAAYLVDDIKGLDASASWKYCPCCGKRIMYHRQDTGWQFNLRTSNLPKVIFQNTDYKLPDYGQWSYDCEGKPDWYNAYIHEDKLIGVHFFRGAYPYELTRTEIPIAWKENRSKYGKFFYENAS